MRKPLVAALFALVIAGAGAAPAVAAPAPAPEPKSVSAEPQSAAAPAIQAVDFAGTVALSNCSGSVIRMPASEADDPALVLSNGHCLETGMPTAGQVIVDRASTRTFSLLNSAGTKVATLRASKIAYGTMTDTDISIYQLTSTYAQIQSTYGISALTLDDAHPTAGTAIKVVSGYWKRIYTCSVQATIPQLREGSWTWQSSIKYHQPGCETIGGTSGSPVVSTSTGEVIGVNNTGNEDGERCTVNNPCEVDAAGNITVEQGAAYGQQTWWLYTCLTSTRAIDLNKAGCQLAKP